MVGKFNNKFRIIGDFGENMVANRVELSKASIWREGEDIQIRSQRDDSSSQS